MHKDKQGNILEHNDPVCGMSVNPDTSSAQSRYEGETFYFCSDDCREKFDMQPEQYAKSGVLK